MPQCSDFLVILPETIIRIPQNSHLAWLRMFYALPRELVEKRPAYLEMPRNIRRVLGSEKYRAMLQSDSFLELVWDCYAWAVWQFFQIPHKDGTYHDIPGDWQNYSGDFPLWRIPHHRDRKRTERKDFTHGISPTAASPVGTATELPVLWQTSITAAPSWKKRCGM